jgi:hypothetical protein
MRLSRFLPVFFVEEKTMSLRNGKLPKQSDLDVFERVYFRKKMLAQKAREDDIIILSLMAGAVVIYYVLDRWLY